ncbi:MAG TPA: alpha/beta hydrolase [Pyrinomonadaceae bacterium]|nr:alpha/beta hydrolase [Pyrinomonadaceae bacterium]
MKIKLKYASALLAFVFFVLAAPASAFNGESKYAKVNGARIHYKTYGSGKEALVLVHGWGCRMGHWREQVSDLSKRNRVITIDLIGHGESDKPELAYNMDLFADAIDAVLRDAKVEKAVLAGHSMGTPVARQFYRKYPQKTLGIIIVDGGLRPFGTKEMREQFLAMVRAPNYKEAVAQMSGQMTGTLSAADKERVKTSFESTPQQVLVSAMESMGQESLYGPDKMNVPVFALLAKSPFWAPDTEEFFRSIAPDFEIQWWDGVSHFLFMDNPKKFNDAVIAFLDKKSLLKQYKQQTKGE